MDDLDEILEALTTAWTAMAAKVATVWVPIQLALILLAALAGSDLPHPATLMRGRLLAHNGDGLWVAEGSEPQAVKITPDTQILRGDAPGTLDGAPRGATAEVIGRLQLNGDFEAVVVRVRDASAASASAAR